MPPAQLTQQKRSQIRGNLSELPWPMGEEIQSSNDQQQQISLNTLQGQEIQSQASQTQHTSESSSTHLRSPRAGALLVEAYGKLVGKHPKTISPNKILFEYSSHLVSIFYSSIIFCIRFLPCRLAKRSVNSFATHKYSSPMNEHQVQSIKVSNTTTSNSSKDALALLDTAELAFKARTVQSWNSTFVKNIVQVLETHPVSRSRGSLFL